jgi:hypothetical protein
LGIEVDIGVMEHWAKYWVADWGGVFSVQDEDYRR